MNGLSSGLLESLRVNLENAYRIDPQRHLKLDAASLGEECASIIALFQEKLGVSAIELTEQIQIPTEVENQTLIVSGKMAGLPVTARFQTEEDGIAIRIVIQSDQIEALKNSFHLFNDQTFSQFGLSTDDNGVQTASVIMPGLGKTLAIANPQFGVAAVSDPNGNDAWLDLIPLVEGRITLGGASLPVMIEMPTEMRGWTLAQADGAQWTFQQLLEQLMPNLVIDGLMPAPLPGLQNLALKNFSLYLDPNFSANDALTLSIGKTENHGSAPLWQIAPSVQFDELTASFWININEQNKLIELTGSGWIQGDFLFGGISVRIHIPIPLSDGAVSLSAYPSLSLKGGLEAVTNLVSQNAATPGQLLPPELVSHIEDLTFTYLSMDASIAPPGIKRAAFALELPKPWPIIAPDRLTLDRIRLQIEITDPITNLQVTGAIAAVFQIAGADVHVSLYRYDPAKEWALSVISKAIPLPGLQDLAKLFGPDVDTGALLPASLKTKRLILNDLELDLKLGSPPAISLFELSLGLEEGDVWDFSPSPIKLEQFAADLKLDWTSGSLVTSGAISGSILMNTTPVSLSAKRPADPGAGWIFEGSSAFLPIGSLIYYIGEKFKITDLPDALNDFILEEARVRFDTSNNDVSFICKAQFPANGEISESPANNNVTITIQLTHTGAAPEEKYEAEVKLTIGDLTFDLRFAKGQKTEGLIATYSHTSAPGSINLDKLLANISAEVADVFPQDLAIDLKDALFVYNKTGEEKKFLFGMDVGAEMSLSSLPLVGKEFPSDRKFGIDDLQILIATKPFSTEEVKKLNSLFPAGVTKLPDVLNGAGAQNGNQDDAKTIALKQGLTIGAKLKLGETTQDLTLPALANGSSQTNGSPAATTTTQAVTTTDNATWLNIQKSLGPVYVDRIGAQYKEAAVWFLLDAALTAAGLTLSLDGLSIGTPISEFDPRFELRGLGIDYRNAAVEIGGAFLKMADKEYAGAAVLKAKQLTISALGLYNEMADGHSSVFVYAVLDYPLGGPSFFFVTGLAAGFGYNRVLNIPKIDKVASFSLVENAVKGGGLPADIGPVLLKLRDDIRPAPGENFLAIGLKFTSFKIVDSFALLTLSFGSHIELNLLGLSSLVAPPNLAPGIPPVAEAQLALKASFLPEKGFLGVQAQLTQNSYVLSKACHLTGGFAFFSWFAGSGHDGDFALTLGGYHPHFNVPAHYPAVPRLGFNWQVSPEISLKGNAYFALTASTLMAGGYLEANWQSGSTHAWFKLGADFLIAWQPYHYEISAYVDMSVDVTFEFFGTQRISVDAGANMNIWGPEFSGKATIHLKVISFTVEFGAAASHTPPPIDWETFKSSFLPADKDVCSVSVIDGMIGRDSQDAADLGVINPRYFSLATNSVVPSTTAQYAFKAGKQAIPLSRSPGRFGIGAMAVAAADLTSTQTITIKREGDFVGDDFEYTPIFKNVPTGLWGESLAPQVNGKQFVENALSGFEIRPKIRSKPGETAAIERRKLQDNGLSGQGEYNWESVKPFAAAPFESEQKRRDELRRSLAAGAASRNAILAALGFTPDDLGKIALSAALADDFLIAPQIEQSERL